MLFSQLFKWFDATLISQIIRDSTYIFPVVEVLHLFGLTLLLGTVTRRRHADARRRHAPAVRFRSGRRSSLPWSVGAAIRHHRQRHSAFPVGSHEVLRQCGFSLQNVVPARRHHFVFRDPAQNHFARFAHESRAQMKVIAVLSLVLWYGVAIAGRAIAFV